MCFVIDHHNTKTKQNKAQPPSHKNGKSKIYCMKITKTKGGGCMTFKPEPASQPATHTTQVTNLLFKTYKEDIACSHLPLSVILILFSLSHAPRFLRSLNHRGSAGTIQAKWLIFSLCNGWLCCLPYLFLSNGHSWFFAGFMCKAGFVFLFPFGCVGSFDFVCLGFVSFFVYERW